MKPFGIAAVLVCTALRAAPPVRWIQQLGGSGGNTVTGMSTDAQGNVYVAGNTTSVDLPVRSAFQPRPASSALVRISGPGNNWSNLYQPAFTSISFLAAAPSNPGTLYAIAGFGLLRTSDNGATWAQTGTLDTGIVDFAVNSSNPDVLYAARSVAGVFRSTDAGATFQPINNGIPPDFFGKPPIARHVWADPYSSSVVYAATSGGFIRSANGGDSWQLVFNDVVSSIGFDPFIRGTLYTAGSGGQAQVSADNGLTFRPLNPGGFQPAAIVADPRRAGVLYGAGLSSATGIMISRDHGATWQAAAVTIPAQQIKSIAADPSTGSIYVAYSLPPKPGSLGVPIGNATPQGDQIVSSADLFQTLTPVGPPTLAPVNTLAVSNGSLFAGTEPSPDVYVAKFDSLGNLLYLTYFGGSGIDQATAMAVDPSGGVYVTGKTTSMNFPVTPGAFAAAGQTFVFKLNPDGSLGYSTYFTDSLTTPVAIAADPAGHAFLTGQSYNDLPVTPGAYRAQSNETFFCAFPIGCISAVPDSFATEFDASGSSLVFSTYFPGGSAIAAVPDGVLILGGALYKLSPDGSSVLSQSPPLGGGTALAVAANGAVYVAGTVSSDYKFPATPGAFQMAAAAIPHLIGSTEFVPRENAAIMKLDAGLNIVAATLYGGESHTFAGTVAVGPGGDVLIGGSTQSYGLPLRNSIWAPFGGNTGYIAQFSSDLSTLKFATSSGDGRLFSVRSVAWGADGALLLAGAALPSSATLVFGLVYTNLTTPAAAFVDSVAPVPSALRVDGFVNAASRLSVSLSPGEAIEVQGSGFGADAVLFLNGAPVASSVIAPNKIGATVPLDTTAPYANLEVHSGGQTSNSVLAPIAAAWPGVFSADGTGLGQGFIRNEDGTLNSPSNPAAAGSAVTIFATGVGPAGVLSVNALVAGTFVPVVSVTTGPIAGLPGDVAGIIVRVPAIPMPPATVALVSVSLRIYGYNSQSGLALSVKLP